jgi:hypothetical protein
MIRRMAAAAVVTFGLGGCARTVGPEQFLYLYRRAGGPTYNREGVRTRYTGTDGAYHYLDLRESSFGRGAGHLLLHGGYRDQTLRCRAADLPGAFPDDFETLSQAGTLGGERLEPPEATRRYVREYLESSGDRSAPQPGGER